MNNVNQHITRLDWDADFFGIEVGRLSTKQEELHLKDSLFDLVYIHSKKKLINTRRLARYTGVHSQSILASNL